MSPLDIPLWTVRLRTERKAQLWDVPDMARELRQLTPDLPDTTTLAKMIKKWETGQHLPGARYWLLYARALGIPRGHLFALMSPPVAPRSPVRPSPTLTSWAASAASLTIPPH
ncbi:hypothetical protein [Nonomuraea angiospora]|uniref:hypothetical protein n=1 Tax=Nonomuraea angiospora TaxID=46172 RepID=UPI0029A280C1|nr:hypothetical protein [Nonomuraea angiospora]MDX3099997.1 hypothetical protein [Nonomuraea angiospora]